MCTQIGRAFFNGAPEFAATDAHPRHRKRNIIRDSRLLIAPAIAPNDTREMYSHDRGYPCVDHFSFCAWHSFQGGTGENKVQQKISEIGRGPFIRCEFNRVHTRTVGGRSARAGTAFSVEEGYRHNDLLDWRETGSEESSAQPRELMGPGLDEKLRWC